MKKTVSQKMIVKDNQTAEYLGSGLLPVLSTPALVAFMENTAMQLIELPQRTSSVGTAINIKHLKASKIGDCIRCFATLISNEGKIYCFELKAFNEKGELIGEATHERYIIDIKIFMAKLQ
ncbi:MAG: thioesterase family protein [Paludibacter sp.]|nr:thioesterase family protein [Paludibacter sp.]